MGPDRIDGIYCNTFGSNIFSFLYSVHQNWKEFTIIESELILDVEYDRDQTLKQGLLSLELLLFVGLDNLVSNPFKFLIKHFVRAIYNNFSKTSNSSSMMNFIGRFFKNTER